jgi:hypothetical protein
MGGDSREWNSIPRAELLREDPTKEPCRFQEGHPCAETALRALSLPDRIEPLNLGVLDLTLVPDTVRF